MNYLIKGGNAYAALRIELKNNEFIHARENAICAFSPEITFTKKVPAGFFRKLASKFSGNHLEMQTIGSSGQEGWVMLAPPMNGAVIGIDPHGKNILMTPDAFLAASREVQTNTRLYPLAKNKFILEKFEAIRFSGEGLVFLNGFGAIEALSLMPEKSLRIHPLHLLAWEEQLVIQEADRGFISITGPGRLWLQTRNPVVSHDWLDGLKDAFKSASI